MNSGNASVHHFLADKGYEGGSKAVEGIALFRAAKDRLLFLHKPQKNAHSL